MNYVIAIIGIAILFYDGWLASEGKPTISQTCQGFFPPAIDWCVGVAGWIALCVIKRYWEGFDFTLGIFIAGLWGHVWIANKERYEK